MTTSRLVVLVLAEEQLGLARPAAFSVQSALSLRCVLLAISFAGDGEDRLGRAVVLLEPHDLRVGVILLELEDVLDVGPAPGVDRLVRVADDADVAVPQRQRVGDDVLGVVRVLVLVDQDVLEPLLQLRAAPPGGRGTRGRSSSRSSKSSALFCVEKLLVLRVNPRDRARW